MAGTVVETADGTAVETADGSPLGTPAKTEEGAVEGRLVVAV